MRVTAHTMLLILYIFILLTFSHSMGNTVVVRVMTQNLFYGGDTLNMTSTDYCVPKHSCKEDLSVFVDIFKEEKADIISLTETEGNVEDIARRMGPSWYWSARTHVISTFPMLEVEGLAVLVEVAKDSFIAVSTLHALSAPYGPYWAVEGRSKEDVVHLESSFRAPPVLARVAMLSPYSSTIIAGDFNSPGVGDWDAAKVAQRGLPYALEWPLAGALQSLGWVDAFRNVSAEQFGFTWTPGGPDGRQDGPEVDDRVDWILVNQGMGRVRNASVVRSRNPYPSDHWGVVAELELDPKQFESPLLEVSRIRLELGEPWRFYCATDSPVLLDGVSLGSCVHGWNDGPVLSVAGAHVIESGGITRTLWVVVTGDEATLQIESLVPLRVSISNGPGMLLDFLAAGPCAPFSVDWPNYNWTAFVYTYTNAMINGTVTLAPPFFMEDDAPVWPLPVGCVELRLFRDDDPTQLVAMLRFQVPGWPLWLWITVGIVGLSVIGVFLALLIVVALRRRRTPGYQQVITSPRDKL